jgi:hypothetical protein
LLNNTLPLRFEGARLLAAPYVTQKSAAALQFAEKLCFWVAQRFTAAISRLF